MATPIRKGGRNQPRACTKPAERAKRPEPASRSLAEMPRYPAPGCTTVQKVSEVLKRVAPFSNAVINTRVQFVATTRSAYWPVLQEMKSWPHIVDPDSMARAFLAGLGTSTGEAPHACMPEGSLSMQEYTILASHCTGQLREVPLFEELMRFYPKMSMRDAIFIEMRIQEEIRVLQMNNVLINHITSAQADYRMLGGRAVRRIKLPNREEDGVVIEGAHISFDYRLFSGFVPNSTFKIKSGITIYYGAELTQFSDLNDYRGMAITGFTQIVSATIATPAGEACIVAANID